MAKNYDHLFKLLLVGDVGVGKTSILIRFTENVFVSFEYVTTIGLEFKVKTLRNIDGKAIKLQIWDMTGQERYYSWDQSGTTFYRGINGIMRLYDVTNTFSFDKIGDWITEAKRCASPDVVWMILGNKCDLQESRVISTEKGEMLAKHYQVNFIETSAKSSINVDQAFHMLTRDIYDKKFKSNAKNAPVAPAPVPSPSFFTRAKDIFNRSHSTNALEWQTLNKQLRIEEKKVQKDVQHNQLQQPVSTRHLVRQLEMARVNQGEHHTEMQLQLTELQKKLELEIKKNDLHQKQEELLHCQIEEIETETIVKMQLQHSDMQEEYHVHVLHRQIEQHTNTIQQLRTEITHFENQLESRPWVLQREEVQLTNERIGGGAYGEVRVAVFRGTRVAAKHLHELIVSRHNTSIFTREMDISSKIHHPNIVQFIGATRVDNPILLYELMATSLYKRLQQDESLSHQQIAEICQDIVLALCYLHQWRPDPIIHRDVSSPNVLMEPLANNRWRSKLSDFGSASLQLHVKTVIPGNPAYAAPEAIVPQHHTPAMDVYSFGVLATEMALHCAPEMDSGRHEERAYDIDWLPLKTVVLKCIHNDHSQRLTSAQLLNELSNLTNY